MASKKEEDKTKTCFVVMPIADMEDYESGHFTRVYNHLIKPACINAGFTPIRADDVASSNYIIIDILKKIIESDMVICDLSGRNPNVMYELGIRQAFNLPTVLIKDMKTNRIFDIQGLRHADYNQSLRIDTVERNIESISSALIETERANGEDINSIIQLLRISPATLPTSVELSNESRILLSAITDLSNRIENIENTNLNDIQNEVKIHKESIIEIEKNIYKINGFKVKIGDSLFINGNLIGTLHRVGVNSIYVMNKEGRLRIYKTSGPSFKKIDTLPF